MNKKQTARITCFFVKKTQDKNEKHGASRTLRCAGNKLVQIGGKEETALPPAVTNALTRVYAVHVLHGRPGTRARARVRARSAPVSQDHLTYVHVLDVVCDVVQW